MSNPWNGKVILEAFWWNCWNNSYPYDWYTYLAKLAPLISSLGFDGIWTPPPCKGASPAENGMGYAPFDYYDLGQKDQQGSVGTRFGTLDSFLRLVAVAHANGLDVYPDIVLDHCDGGDFEPGSPTDLALRQTAFQYAGFAGAGAGRWAKSWYDFHANPVHWTLSGDWTTAPFGEDICYQGRCSDTGAADSNCWMSAGAREWFVWFVKQTGVDGFRFDDVKGYPPEVVEDLLFNAMGPSTQYFSVGEYVEWGTTQNVDSWAASTFNRCGTFDYNFRNSLLQLVESNGFFDMGSLPNAQQQNRYKTVPFVNNHDVYRGSFWDSSGDNSTTHDQRTGDWALNANELAATIDPDNSRAALAYAAMMAVDGSPQVYYEDLFINFPPARFDAPAAGLPTRPYIENLVWCHQKLEFKAGDYLVRYQGSQQLLLIERSAKVIIGLNNDGSSAHDAWIATNFGPNVELHDYSGGSQGNVWTNQDGWVDIVVPPLSYSVWGPAGITGGFAPGPRTTTQEFQMDDDLGDSAATTPGYGGKLIAGTYHKAGALWAAANSNVQIWVYVDNDREVDLQVCLPDPATGDKSNTNGTLASSGPATSIAPLYYAFVARSEGYYQINAQLANAGDAPVRAYTKVEYLAPASSNLF